MRWFLRRVALPGIGLAPVMLLFACSSLKPQTAESECGPLVDCPPARAGMHPIQVCNNPTVMTLAGDLDHLEKHIDWYGSVVAKVPDVWGQARLTQYRDEFEKVMSADKDGFVFGLQGALARSDTAYFASATALSFAAQPKARGGSGGGGGSSTPPKLVDVEQTATNIALDQRLRQLEITETLRRVPAPAPAAPAPAAVKPLELAEVDKLVSGTDTVLANRNAARLPEALKFGQAAGQVGIEPTEFLAQKKRYLDFLAQIRRENEGDDTADSPGYSLNLMRIPVSVLPGKKTDTGYGAEMTMTVTPVLGDDLLPMTFRNLVQNDLVIQLGFPLTQVLNGDDFDALLTPEVKLFIEGTDLLIRWAATRSLGDADIRAYYDRLTDADKNRVWVVLSLKIEDGAKQVPKPGQEDKDGRILQALKVVLDDQARLSAKYSRQTGPSALPAATSATAVRPAGLLQPGAGGAPAKDLRLVAPGKGLSLSFLSDAGGASAAQQATSRGAGPKVRPGAATGRPPGPPTADTLRKVSQQFKVPGLSFSNGLDNRTAVPTSQLFDVYGDANLFAIGFGASQAFGAAIETQGYAHLPDIQAYLREEARAAYQFLAQPGQRCLWDEFCTPELVTAIRSRQVAALQDLRDNFRTRVEILTQTDQYRQSRPDNELQQFSKTTAMAWCIIVDAALLTDRLVRDMKETASAKGKPLAGCDRWCPYFLPDPPAECRRAFNAYVQLRWPIHVFALDPYTQEQNVGDSLSTRRETQLALAIAFTNGQISARNMTKYVRRLEAEYQTVALNRTQVGFSHGENVFGWRFYPRYQTPDTKSNLEVLFREQLIGGPNRNALLRDRQLEPGERECVAVVLMPSFVPYVTVDTASNWFPLPNPKHKVLDTTQAVKLSRAVQTIKTCAEGVKDAACYRDGEFTRLVRRAEQLEARLPLQTLTSPVPILNANGGFEMFANGTTDLAPELFGWYGAPGIDPSAPTTTLFLVGDHFSPLRTRVLVGNQAVDNTSPLGQSLLSRQVMQVTFKNGAYPLAAEDGTPTKVRVHVATPYGVTRELEIPVVKQAPTKKEPGPGFSFGAAKLTAQYILNPITTPAGVEPKLVTPSGCNSGNDEAGLKINWIAPGWALTPKVKVVFELEYPSGGANPAALKLPCVCTVIGEVKGKTVVIPKAALDNMVIDLVGQIAQVGPPFARDANPLDKGLKTKKVTITPVVMAGAEALVAQGAETTDQLTIEFKQVACCPPGQPCPPAMQPPVTPALPSPIAPMNMGSLLPAPRPKE